VLEDLVRVEDPAAAVGRSASSGLGSTAEYCHPAWIASAASVPCPGPISSIGPGGAAYWASSARRDRSMRVRRAPPSAVSFFSENVR
jgi:hypothetical protein